METKAIVEACAIAGGVVALAKAIGVTSSEISMWKSGRRSVPVKKCCLIEEFTRGKVTRQQLRRDYAEIWPELNVKAPASTHAPTVIKKESKPKLTADKPADVKSQVWDDFLALRRAKKAPLTVTALNRLRNAAEKAGLSLNDALMICCERGWQGFNDEWLKRDQNRSGGGFYNKQEALENSIFEVVKRANDRDGIETPEISGFFNRHKEHENERDETVYVDASERRER